MTDVEKADALIDMLKQMKKEKESKEAKEKIGSYLTQNMFKIHAFDYLAKEYPEGFAKHNDVDRQAEEIIKQMLTFVKKHDEDPESYPMQGSIVFDYPLVYRDLQDLVESQVQRRVRYLGFHSFKQKCREVLNQIVASYGQEPHMEAIKRKIQHMQELCEANPYSALSAMLEIPCNKCGMSHPHMLAEKEITTLLEKEEIEFTIIEPKRALNQALSSFFRIAAKSAYQNVSQEDLYALIPLGTLPHKQVVTLEGIIRAYLLSR